MSVKGYEITLTTFGIFLIFSFFPILQTMLGYLNGGILYLFELLTTIRAYKLAIILNSVMSIVCLLAYLKAKTKSLKIFTASLSAFFINGLTLFGFESHYIKPNADWLVFIVGAFIIGISLYIVDYIRIKTITKYVK